ncbi:right-handed parallel beta-helix repeat-containing protein [Marinigracilibium pacificum]|uniref:Right-handed parallel beta-helix repeat-containing protein n=1 Tax=Marinigracilibium pacificum TaxID=2729599 RepID=A0A848IXJ9_9BACT|nr:right-handed parallel beta-helix repeat-containing protein [Marinigracilibium pacificum]NMM48041.1 right-handed parallel beta-helix repeat-containing protein [Marinigracilibium pacificum]
MKTKILSLLILIFIFSCAANKISSYAQDSELQNFINGLENGSEYTFEKQTFSTEDPLIIEGKSDLILDFSGSTIFSTTKGSKVTPIKSKENSWPRNRSHVIISNSKNIKIINLNIDGPHQNGGTSEEAYIKQLEAQHGIEINNSKSISIINAKITEIYGDGIYIGNNSSNILIEKCEISKNGRQGIAVTNGQDIIIKNNIFDQIRRAHIDLECNQPTDIINNIIIENNTFGNKRLKWIAAGSSKGKVSNVTVKDNTLNCPADIYLGNKKNKTPQGPYSFINNTTTRRYGNPLGIIWQLFNVDGFTAVNNNILAQEGREMYLVGGSNNKNIKLDNNTVADGKAQVRRK